MVGKSNKRYIVYCILMLGDKTFKLFCLLKLFKVILGKQNIDPC